MEEGTGGLYILYVLSTPSDSTVCVDDCPFAAAPAAREKRTKSKNKIFEINLWHIVHLLDQPFVRFQ
jgi:hypothetical protein